MRACVLILDFMSDGFETRKGIGSMVMGVTYGL